MAEARRGTVRGGAAFATAAYAFAAAMLGTTLPTPLYVLYQRRIGFGGLMTTVVFAAYALGVIATLLLVGRLSDRIGRRPMLLAGLACSAASAVAFLAEGGLPLLFAGRLLSGISAGVFTGTATAAVVELAPERHRGRAALVATAANMLGLGLGPLLSGVLAQYLPGPLVTVYLVDLALVAVAALLARRLPETVRDRRPLRPLRPRIPGVPAAIRPVFAAAAVAGFAGFATLGLFTSVIPSFAARLLGVSNLAVAGALVFTAFAASTAGQLLMRRLGTRRALPWGCLVLTAGVGLVAASLMTGSVALLVAGAGTAGAGQGLSFRAGLTAVAERSPAERRGEIISALFVALYVGISLPVVGIGVLEQAEGLRTAGLVFSVFVAVLCLACALQLARRPLASSAGGDGPPAPPR